MPSTPAGGRGCAVAAVVISILSAAVVAGCVGYGGHKALELEMRVARSDIAVAEYKSYAAHLSAQLQQLQRVDTALGARLINAENGLRAAVSETESNDEDGKRRGRGSSGKGKARAKSESEGNTAAKESELPAVAPTAAAADAGGEGASDEAKGNAKGRKGKRKKGRRGAKG